MNGRIDLTRHGGRRQLTQGQALVEFALALPLVLLMVVGMVDMGRFVFGHSALSQAAREGARVGAVEAYWIGRGDPVSPTYDASCNQPGGPVCPADLAALRADVLAATNRMLTPFGPIVAADLYTSCDASAAPTGSWTSQTCNSRNPGALMSVRVVLRFQAITPIIRQLFTSITEVASATMVIN